MRISIDAAMRALFSRSHPPPALQHLRSPKAITEHVLLGLYRFAGIKKIGALRELLKQGRRRRGRPEGLLKGEQPADEGQLTS